MISDSEAEKALQFLSDTDVRAAKARALVEGLQEQRKTIKAICFQDLKGPVTERETLAYADPRYIEHLEKLKSAIYEWETFRNKRLTASMTIEMWRSLNANRRSGNV